MLTYYIILLLFIAMGLIFLGLHLSKDFQNSTLIVLFWIIYLLVTSTFFNVFLLGYFWSVVRKKTGPIGIRGEKGSIGDKGINGRCVGNSNQNIAVFQIIEYLNKIHKNNLEKNDLDSNDIKYTIIKDDDGTRLINNYMDRKIRTIVFSSQFESLLEVLPLDILETNDKQISLNYLITYLQKIVAEWYYLIYEQKEDWFYQQYDDMKADWKSDNPFNEIRKYDVFYWGSQRTFKPLKLESCQSYSSNQRNPKIHTMLTNDYDLAYDNLKSGVSKRMNIWRPKSVTTKMNGKDVKFYPIGDVITSGNPKTFDYKKTGKTIIGEAEINTGKKGNGPSKTTLLVADGTIGKSILSDPKEYKEMWKHEKKMSLYEKDDAYDVDKLKDEGRIWQPIPKDDNYICLGDIASNKYNPNEIKVDKDDLSRTELEEAEAKEKKNMEEYLKYNHSLPEIKCINKECVEEIPQSVLDKEKELTWQSKQGENIKYNGEIYTIGNSIGGKPENSYNTFRADNYFYYDHNKTLEADRDRNVSDYEHSKVVGPDGGKFYRIKEKCLKKQEFVPKDVEEDHSNIGIGWYGLPSNTESKYSVFHWMGLIPEGMITNSYSNKKFYIVHYGGPKFNIYNILVYNTTSGEYTNAFETSGMSKLTLKKIQKNSSKQHFKIIKNNQGLENIIHLESVHSPRRFVSIGNNPTNDLSNNKLIRTKDVTTQFKFMGAFNTLESLNSQSSSN